MRILLVFSLILFIACNNSSKDTDKKGGKIYSMSDNQEGAEEITCWGIGPIELDSDMQVVEEKAGKANVSQDSLFLEGNFEGFITKVWKDTAKEIVIHWKEKQAPFSNIEFLEISRPESPYHFMNGIKIGTGLKEIEKLNGGTAITLYGFGWDYGGTFVDFNKGKLAGDIPCFGGVFSLPDSADTEAVKELLGDIKISSSQPAFDKYEPVLSVIRVKSI